MSKGSIFGRWKADSKEKNGGIGFTPSKTPKKSKITYVGFSDEEMNRLFGRKNSNIDEIEEIPPVKKNAFNDDNIDHLEEIEKFNPYHDSKGRFASANGAVTISNVNYTPAGQTIGAKYLDDPTTIELKELHKKHGTVDLGLQMTTDKEAFCDALEKARQSSDKGGAVDPQTPEAVKDYKTFLSADGMAGVAVKPDGDITAVFKNANSEYKGAVNDLILTARAYGGTKMDCYGEHLANAYEACGYTVVARVPFDPSYVTDPYLLATKPDVYVMMKNTDSLETAFKKNAEGAYKLSSPTELQSLKPQEYGEAMQYRDKLLEKQEGKK